MDDMVKCLRFELGVHISDWAYYPTCVPHYEEYLKKPESEPVHVYPEEQNALELGHPTG